MGRGIWIGVGDGRVKNNDMDMDRVRDKDNYMGRDNCRDRNMLFHWSAIRLVKKT